MPTLPRFLRFIGLACALAGGATSPGFAQTTYTWNDSTSTWTQPGAWTPAGPDWTQYSRLDDALATFGNDASIGFQPTIATGQLFARGITFDNTGADWNLFGTTGTLKLGSGGLTLTGGGTTELRANIHLDRAQSWDISSGGTVNILGSFSGVTTLTKSGSGTLVIDSASGSFTGTIAITGGTVLVGGATNGASALAIRNSAIDFGTSAGTIAPGGGGQHIRMGQVSGSNVDALINSVSQVVHMTALKDATFTGVVSMEGLNLYGTGTQTLNGTTTGLVGTMSIHGRSGLTLEGTGTRTTGAINATSLVLRGGTLTLDNSAGNTTNANGRLLDNATLRMIGGGTLHLIGNGVDGTTENLAMVPGNAAQALLPGAHTIRVDHNGGAGGTVLGFNAGASNFTLRTAFSMTVDFVGTGGTLGAAGANPRIVWTGGGVPFTGTNISLLSNHVQSDLAIGWATVNGTEWAGYGANGIVAVAPTITSGTNGGIQAATATDLVVFNPSSNQTLTAPVTTGTFKITPNGSTTLDVGTHSINTTALMLAGPNDFAITGTTGKLFGTAADARYVHVTDPDAVLSTNLGLNGADLPVTKSGPGTFALTGSSNQVGFTSSQNIHIIRGTLRGTVAALGGGASTDGDFTVINFRGGVLEIDGAGSTSEVTFDRAISTSSASASGGVIRFNLQAIDRGEGGFSAFNAPGGVRVSLMTAIGGSTRALLQWNAPNSDPFLSDGYALLFGSPHSNSRITLANALQLDDGTGSAYVAREVHVMRGAGNLDDYARLSGVINGTLASDLLKTGTGVLELGANNTYRGNTLIQEGTLVIAGGSSIGTAASRTGNVVVERGAVLAGNGSIMPDLNKSVVVNPGGAIRGGSPVSSSLELHPGTLTIHSDLTINSTAGDRGTIQFEAHRTAANTASTSRIILGTPFNLNLNPGAGNKFAIELVETGVTNPLQVGESYTVTLISVGAGGNIRLNGVDLPDGVIAQSNYVLQSSSFTLDPNSTLQVLTDGTSKHLQLTFGVVPVPEPALVLALATGVLALSRLGRSRRNRVTSEF